jgi:uncharacterized membrane protein YgaE (UPF0421/DUF939 family)
MRIGARVWKTAAAVTIALAISHILHLKHPILAGVAAIICMQPTVAGTLKSGWERIQATVTGAFFSLSALLLMEQLPALQAARPVIVGLTVLVVMAVIIRLRWLDSLVLAAATVVVIMVLPGEENIYHYAASRTFVTFVGIVVATAVNALFLTPHHRVPLWRRLEEFTGNTSALYRQAVEAFCFRKLEVARDVRRALAEGTELEHAVTTRMQWLEEEARLRRAIHWREEKEIEVLRRAVEALATARQSTATIARATDEALSRHPAYAHEPARAYEILWELAQLSFEILERAETAFSERPTEAVEPTPDWTEEVHKQLVRSIRQAHKEPLDIFPLAEVAVVGYEIRRVTEAAAELAAALVRRAS